MTDSTMLDRSKIEKVIEAFQRGVTFGQVLGVSKDELENLYALGRTLYAAKNFKDSKVVFQMLTIYNPNDERFWLGLAGSRQGLEDYEGAIDAYQLAAIRNGMKDPTPLLYAVRCMLKLNRKEDAVGGLEGIVLIGDESLPEVKKCHIQAKALLQLLKGQKESAQ